MATHRTLTHINDSSKGNILAIERKHNIKAENFHDEGKKINFFIPKCSACKNEMQFLEGDVIYGDKWYHSSCWDEIQKIIGLVS